MKTSEMNKLIEVFRLILDFVDQEDAKSAIEVLAINGVTISLPVITKAIGVEDEGEIVKLIDKLQKAQIKIDFGEGSLSTKLISGYTEIIYGDKKLLNIKLDPIVSKLLIAMCLVAKPI